MRIAAHRNVPRRAFVLGILAAAVSAAAVLAAPKLARQPRDREITIDGIADEWEGAWTYLKKQKIDVGVMNDEDFLYVCLVTEEQATRSQILRQGLTLWLGPEADVPGLGVRFPLGMRSQRQSAGACNALRPVRDGSCPTDPGRDRVVIAQTDIW